MPRTPATSTFLKLSFLSLFAAPISRTYAKAAAGIVFNPSAPPPMPPSDDTSAPVPAQADPRRNVFGSPLLEVTGSNGPTTGFFRNNFCDASRIDPASHTVAAVVSPTFLNFSAERGNDLWPLFPALKANPNAGPCIWCICASRWTEALFASRSHPQGEAIVPKVILESTHESALRYAPKEELERFAVGGNGDGGDVQATRRTTERAGR